MQCSICSVLSFVVALAAHAQGGTSCSRLGSDALVVLEELVRMPDDGVLGVGWTTAVPENNGELLLLRMDAQGDTLWTRLYGGSGHELGGGVALRADGTALVCGSTKALGNAALDNDLWVMAVDADGAPLWSTVVRTAGGDHAVGLALTQDGGCLVLGTLSDAGAAHLALVRMDANGNMEWSRAIAGPTSFGSDIVSLSDGGFAVVGTVGFGTAAVGQLVMRLNAAGDVLWQRVLTGVQEDQGRCIAANEGLDLLVAGTTNGSGDFPIDVTLARLDSEGELEWSSTFSGEGTDIPGDIISRSDGTWTVLSSSYSFGTGGVLLTEVGASLSSSRLYTSPIGELVSPRSVLRADGGLWVSGFYYEGELPLTVITHLDQELEACPDCASWVPVSAPGQALSSSVVAYPFSPLGVAIPFEPTVTSGMNWTPICLSNNVAEAEAPVPGSSWIAHGTGALSIAPPGTASAVYTWSILDVAGRELASGRAAGGQRTDTGFTATGVHVLVLRSDDAQHTERFVLP